MSRDSIARAYDAITALIAGAGFAGGRGGLAGGGTVVTVDPGDVSGRFAGGSGRRVGVFACAPAAAGFPGAPVTGGALGGAAAVRAAAARAAASSFAARSAAIHAI